MKQIFRIFAIAAVALSAAACQNDINDTIAPEGEGVSIRVTIADQTRVALGDFEEGKGYKLTFEEGDQILVSNAWGGTGTDADYWFTYTKTEGDTYVFTCTTEGVGALVGTEQDVFYFGGAPAGNGSVCNTAKESISGVGMNGGTSSLGTEPIVLDVLPVLKYSSEYQVTFTASTGTFSSEAGRWATSYTATKTGTDIYIPMYTTGTYTLTASVLGKEVKSKELTFEKNKIYNLGTIEAPEIEKDNANITIDGVFTDWDDVKTCVATVPEGVSYKDITLMKGYADNDYIHLYIEFKNNMARKLAVYIDPDYSNTTGYTGNWGQNGASVLLEGNLYNFNSDKTEQLEAIKYEGSSNKYTGTDGASDWSWEWLWKGTNTISCVPTFDEVANITKLEFAIVRETLDTIMDSSVSGNVGIGLILSNAGGSPIGRMPASTQGSSAASMLLIEVPAAE